MRRNPFRLLAIIGLLLGQVSGCTDDDGSGGTGPSADDASAPFPVTDLALVFDPGNGTVRLSWTAPADDSSAERVTAYEIRYEYTGGAAPVDFWETAAAAADPPEPGPPGTLESYEIADPQRARDLYVGVIAIDEAGNRSAAPEPAAVHVTGYRFGGRCTDVFTGLPVEHLGAAVSNGESFAYLTDEAGEFAHTGEIDGGLTHVEIHSTGAAAAYHAVNETLLLKSDSVRAFVMIPVEPVTVSWAPNLLGLFNRLAFTLPAGAALSARAPSAPTLSPRAPEAPQPRILAKWRRLPVACFAPPFVNANGVDYELQAKLAAARWMEKTGKPLFEFVDSPPDTGITVVYKSRSEMGGIAFTSHTRDAEGHPLRDEIRIVSEAANPLVIYRVFLHELGHTISLGHTDDPSCIMFVGQPLPADISDDEARVVQLHASLPVRIDMTIYDENAR